MRPLRISRRAWTTMRSFDGLTPGAAMQQAVAAAVRLGPATAHADDGDVEGHAGLEKYYAADGGCDSEDPSVAGYAFDLVEVGLAGGNRATISRVSPKATSAGSTIRCASISSGTRSSGRPSTGPWTSAIIGGRSSRWTQAWQRLGADSSRLRLTLSGPKEPW